MSRNMTDWSGIRITSGSYDVLKKSAECALVQQYPMKNAAFVRFPYVIGRDD